MPGLNLRNLLSAYGVLCGRWVNDRTQGAARAAHQRYFKTVLALPLFAAPLALAAGLSAFNAFALLAAAAALSLALAAFVSVSGRLNTGLCALSASIGAAFALLTPLAGPAALLPLAILAGAESFFIARKAAFALRALVLENLAAVGNHSVK